MRFKASSRSAQKARAEIEALITDRLVRSGVVRGAWAAGVALLALNPSSVAYACSCSPDSLSLALQVERADNVLVAKITGCAADRLSKDGYCHGHGWTFQTIEDLKGSNAVIRQEPWDSSGAVTSCDVALKVGETYLLFLREGRTYMCSGTLILSRSNTLGEIGTSEVGARRIEVLRAFRDGAIDRVTGPWYFVNRGWSCAVEHLLDGASMSFNYQIEWPPNARPAGAAAVPEPGPYFSVVPFPRVELAGPTLLEVDGDPVPLTRHTVTWPEGASHSSEGLRGDAALALLETMSRPVEMVYSGTRPGRDGTAEHFRAITHTALFRDAARQFMECMAAHPRRDAGRN